MRQGKNEHVLMNKLVFTALILVIYICGRHVPLVFVDTVYYRQQGMTADQFFGMAVGGDAYRISLFALGISPYMVASILMTAVMAVRKASTRSRISMKKTEHALMIIAFCIAVFEAITSASQMKFFPSAVPHSVMVLLAAAELTGGAVLIAWLAEQNKNQGIGGQSLLIAVNLLGSVAAMVKELDSSRLLIPVLCAVAAMAVTLAMENGEFRMPVQRIFIYSIYKDKNYIPVKYNPIGVLPIMFSTSIFALLHHVLVFAGFLAPAGDKFLAAAEKLTFSHPIGLAIYVMIVYMLTVGLSLVLLSPGELSEHMQKQNDSLCGICSGKPTKRYLIRVLVVVGMFSATVMSICIVGSLLVERWGGVDDSLIMFPSLVMMLTSILTSLFREFKTAVSFEAYRAFL